MEKLIFNETMSLESFKAINGVKTINVVRSPKTSKLFFTTDVETVSGAVSGEVEDLVNPVISRVTGDTGSFYMLHNRKTNNVIATF